VQAAIRAGREASIKLELIRMEGSKKLTGNAAAESPVRDSHGLGERRIFSHTMLPTSAAKEFRAS
jgi:hypothetical protein